MKGWFSQSYFKYIKSFWLRMRMRMKKYEVLSFKEDCKQENKGNKESSLKKRWGKLARIFKPIQ